MVRKLGTQIRRYAIALLSVAAIVFFYKRVLPVNPTTVALTLLVAVLLCSAYWGLRVAVVLALVSTAAFNFFFLPPFGTFTIADPQNWIALFSLLITALVASNLSERARREAEHAKQQRHNLEQLYALSQQLLTVENVAELMNAIPRLVADSFGTEGAALVSSAKPTIYRSRPDLRFDAGSLNATLARGELSVSDGVSYIPLRIGVRTVGALAIVGGTLHRETLEAISSLVGIGIERTRAIEELTQTRALQENEKLRTALLDSVAHELRTPLTSIKASVTGLMSGGEMNQEQRGELLTIINEEADRLNRLVGQAAEMAQLDAQLFTLDVRPCDVSDVVDAAVSETRAAVRQHQLKVEIPHDLPKVPLDFERIREVLVNLIENAAKYSPAETPILISAERKDGQIVISVSDRGPGIDSFEQALIFDKFYRGRRQRYAAHGSGMGLAIAKVIVEAHRGTIGVVSQPGSGSVFSVTLPI